MALGLPRDAAMPKHAGARFHVLAKPTGAVCNLDCKYCIDRPMRMMADLLRQGRYADEAMTMLAHDASA